MYYDSDCNRLCKRLQSLRMIRMVELSGKKVMKKVHCCEIQKHGLPGLMTEKMEQKGQKNGF